MLAIVQEETTINDSIYQDSTKVESTHIKRIKAIDKVKLN